MLPTMIKLASTRAVAELGGRRIVGGMVGRRRPSPFNREPIGGSAVSAASVISKSDYTSLDPLPESEAALDDPDVKPSAPVGGRIKSQVLASEADDFWDNLLRPDETEPNRVLSSVLETTHEGKAAGS